MQRSSSLSIPFAGYATALALLLAVAVTAILSLDAAAAERLTAIKSLEHRAALAERLQWQNAIQVAAARGFVITADPSFRHREQAASQALNMLQRDLRRSEDDARAAELLSAVIRAAKAYDRMQHELLALRETLTDPDQIVSRFERDLLPLRRALGLAIDRYVSRQRELLMRAYSSIQGQQARTKAVAVSSVVLAGLASTGLFLLMSRALTRTYQRERSALERTEAAVRARDEMLGIVAHDLRNPLSAIAMKAALLGDASDPHAVRRHAGAIEQIADRMERLIASLLDVASIDAGKLSIQRSRCEVASVVADALALFEAKPGRESIALACVLGEPDLAFHGDRERVLQVLSNLVGNALKFTEAHGSVRVTVRRDGAFIHFSVEDTGPGIHPEDMAHLFDRFWKKDRARTRGTGLGLFICKGIVDAHGGRIWAESRPGAGATFHFTVPAAASA